MTDALPSELTSYLLGHADVFSDVLDHVLRAPGPSDFRGHDKKRQRLLVVDDSLFHTMLVQDMRNEIYRLLVDTADSDEGALVALLHLGAVNTNLRAQTQARLHAFIIRVNFVDIICHNVVAYFDQPVVRTLFLEALRGPARAVYLAWQKLLGNPFWNACLEKYLTPLAKAGTLPAFIVDGHAPILMIAALAGRDPDFDAVRLQDFAWRPGMDAFFAAFGTIPDHLLDPGILQAANLFVPLAIRLRMEGDPETDNAAIALLMEQFEFDPSTCAHLAAFSKKREAIRTPMLDDLTVLCAYAASDDTRLARFVAKMFSVRVPVPAKQTVLVHLLNVLICKGEEGACLPRVDQMIYTPLKALYSSVDYQNDISQMDYAYTYAPLWLKLADWLGDHVVDLLIKQSCDTMLIREAMDVFEVDSPDWKTVIPHYRVDLFRLGSYKSSDSFLYFQALYSPGDSTTIDPSGARQLAMFDHLASFWDVFVPRYDGMIVSDALYDRVAPLASKPGQDYRRQVDLANLAWRVMYATEFDPVSLRIDPSNFGDYDSVVARVLATETYGNGNFGGIEKRMNHILVCALEGKHQGPSFLRALLKYFYRIYQLYVEYMTQTSEERVRAHFKLAISVAFSVPTTIKIHPSNLWLWLQSPLRIALTHVDGPVMSGARANHILAATDPLRYVAFEPSALGKSIERLEYWSYLSQLRSPYGLAYFFENALILDNSTHEPEQMSNVNIRNMVMNTLAYLGIVVE